MFVTDLPIWVDFPHADKLPAKIDVRRYAATNCAILSVGVGPDMTVATVPLTNTEGMSFDRVYGDAVRALMAANRG